MADEAGEAPGADVDPQVSANNPPPGGAAGGAAAAAPAAAGGAAAGQRRRKRPEEAQEAVDELAKEATRTTLLDRVESQLSGQHSLSRIMFGFAVADDRKIQTMLERSFTNWRWETCSDSAQVTGLLIYAQQAALHFLEGPTELLFRALALFQDLATEPTAAAPSAGMSKGMPGEGSERTTALIGGIRILHFTEMHGVRVTRGWCAVANPTKPQGLQIQLDHDSCPETVFMVYRKFLLLSIKAMDSLHSVENDEDIEDEQLQNCYRRATELMPTVEEATVLLGKNGAELFFTYAEFQRVFVAKFRTVLHSELLWPMPPALSY